VKLRNPEEAWSRAASATIDRAEVERRIGPTREAIEVLTGGFANLNVRVGDGRVLRIKPRPETLAKEATLLRRPWRSFRTPAVLAAGDDFLVLEHLELLPLPATEGAAVGRALAEIHAFTYRESGFLAGDLSIAEPIADEGDGGVGYVHAMLDEAEPFVDAALAAGVRAHLSRIRDDAAATAAQDTPVLLHADFKVSNLRVTPSGELVVLDWEFAWAGPRWMDVGQLLRWDPPEPFVRAFVDTYRAGGGFLVDGWRRIAATIDIGHMLGVHAHNPIMRTSEEIPRRIAETLAAG
jgi:aminoglycoside phosphotransferase (APT) family kinase protein